MLVSGVPPIRARKLRYYADRNFLAPPAAGPARCGQIRYADAPAARDRTTGPDQTRGTDPRLEKAWSELVPSNGASERRAAPRARDTRARARRTRPSGRCSDLPLFAERLDEPDARRGAQPPTCRRSTSTR